MTSQSCTSIGNATLMSKLTSALLLLAMVLAQGLPQSPNIDRAATEPAEAVPNAAAPTQVLLRKQYVPINSPRDPSTTVYKTSYFGKIRLGNQDFTAVFDTGSGHLILPNVRCETETCAKHTRFNRTGSETAVDIEHDGTPIVADAKSREQLTVTFGTGSVTGEFVQDNMCFGESTSTSSEGCVNFRVVVANEMSPEPFQHFYFDGVLGLAMDPITVNPKFSFFGQMVEQHPSMVPRFAVFLARTDEGQSLITFGGHDESLAASNITWAPVFSPNLGYWQVKLKNVRIGNTVLEECAEGDCIAILDTGTSLLGVPKLASRSMHRLLARVVPGEDDAERASTDCRTVPGELIHFEIEGLDGPTVVLGAEDYSRPRPSNLTAPGSEEWELYCRSLLLPVGLQPPMSSKVFIWGEPVLRKYYTIYDWADKRIGFSAAGEGWQRDGSVENAAIGAPAASSLALGAPLAATAAKAQPSPPATAPSAGVTASAEATAASAPTI